MSENSANNKRIAKNTLYLYIRMFLMMAISFYTSRVILQQLGVEDFGIYNLVGGVVALMTFLNSSMAGATSRFLTFDLGRKDFEHLKKTFSSALQIHIAIALTILIIGECIGIWFINTQLNIPENRIEAANVVYQMSLLASIIAIIQVPFSASLISHERMDLYAIIEIANACLKLGAVYILLIFPFDKLIIYSILICCVAILIFIIYRANCIKRFEECHLTAGFHKEIIRPMLAFSGWDLYGNGCVVARQQGTNILLNQFFGVALNAASGVATQVSSAVSLFISNITMSIRPQLIKNYAANDINGIQKLLSFSLIICIILIQAIMIPVYLNIETIMELWLQNVPPYAIQFTKCMLIANAISTANTLFNTVIHATGKIKRLSIIEGSLFLSTLLFSYIGFLYLPNPTITYSIWVAIMAIALIISATLAKRNIKELSIISILNDIKFPIIATICNIAFMNFLNHFFEDGLYKIAMTTIINTSSLIFFIYIFWIIPCYKGNIKSAFKSILK